MNIKPCKILLAFYHFVQRKEDNWKYLPAPHLCCPGNRCHPSRRPFVSVLLAAAGRDTVMTELIITSSTQTGAGAGAGAQTFHFSWFLAAVRLDNNIISVCPASKGTTIVTPVQCDNNANEMQWTVHCSKPMIMLQSKASVVNLQYRDYISEPMHMRQ